jgi:hypothetical protein
MSPKDLYKKQGQYCLYFPMFISKLCTEATMFLQSVEAKINFLCT